MYEIGDYVVKVNSGVCRIENIVEMDHVSDKKGTKYYLLMPNDDRNIKLYVPVEGKNDNIRSVMDVQEAENFISRVSDMAEAWIESDKVREQEYKAAIRSGDPEKLIGIIKNIYIRNRERSEQGKKTTTIDERYCKQAESILYSELAFVLGRNKEDIAQQIVALF